MSVTTQTRALNWTDASGSARVHSVHPSANERMAVPRLARADVFSRVLNGANMTNVELDALAEEHPIFIGLEFCTALSWTQDIFNHVLLLLPTMRPVANRY